MMTEKFASSRPPVIWRVLDGKSGHRNQVIGLTEALERLITVQCHDVSVTTHRQALRCLLPGGLRDAEKLPHPELLIGAGHATHLPLLVLRRKFGGKAIVLMKPTLPMSAFDLNIIPSVHRLRRIPKNVLFTSGPVNRVRRALSLTDREGLILLGGLSDQFIWSDEAVLRQLTQILHANDGVRWTVATSRRTPPSFLKAWETARLPGEFVPFERTGPDWLLQQMQKAGRVWVTCDSMSMVFEALTSGAAVGLLELPMRRRSRVFQSAQQLIQDGVVTSYSAWMAGQPLSPPLLPPQEADRCAQEVITRFLQRPENDAQAA
jgi:mitochondrial fission protein ELM1